jgi:hypothetical protein
VALRQTPRVGDGHEDLVSARLQRELTVDGDLPLRLSGVEPRRGLDLGHQPAAQVELDLLDAAVVPSGAYDGHGRTVHLALVLGPPGEDQGRPLVLLVLRQDGFDRLLEREIQPLAGFRVPGVEAKDPIEADLGRRVLAGRHEVVTLLVQPVDLGPGVALPLHPLAHLLGPFQELGRLGDVDGRVGERLDRLGVLARIQEGFAFLEGLLPGQAGGGGKDELPAVFLALEGLRVLRVDREHGVEATAGLVAVAFLEEPRALDQPLLDSRGPARSVREILLLFLDALLGVGDRALDARVEEARPGVREVQPGKRFLEAPRLLQALRLPHVGLDVRTRPVARAFALSRVERFLGVTLLLE